MYNPLTVNLLKSKNRLAYRWRTLIAAHQNKETSDKQFRKIFVKLMGDIDPNDLEHENTDMRSQIKKMQQRRAAKKAEAAALEETAVPEETAPDTVDETKPAKKGRTLRKRMTNSKANSKVAPKKATKKISKKRANKRRTKREV